MKILATILLVFALLGALLMVVKCTNEQESMEKIESMPGGGLIKSLAGGEIPSADAFAMGGNVALGLAFFSIFGIVAVFLKSKNIGFAAAGIVGLMAILLMIFVPSLDGGKYGGANPKTIAIVIGLIGLAGAGILGFLASKRNA